MKRRKNVYWDWKSLQWKRGDKPLTKAQRKQQTAERKRQAAIARQDKQHAKIAERAERKQSRISAGKQFRQLRSEAKKEQRARELAKQDEALWKELYSSSNPQRAGTMAGAASGDDFETLFRSAMKRNPMAKSYGVRIKKVSGRFTGLPYQVVSDNSDRTFGAYKTKEAAQARLAEVRARMKEFSRGGSMSNPKKKRKRKRKMPAALANYWRKKRAAKAKRRKQANPKKRRRVRRRRSVVQRARRVRNYRKPVTRRRRRKSNPRRKRPVKIIKTNLRKGTKAFKQFVSQVRAQYGKARVL